ncbi:MAG TPA: DNA polymerase III subunit delta' [Smithellaceae bacterium]|nr:DNA polymerase III subunit delta' [Smithellaceae bacterium]HRS82598.1 DNA polymerase III subunit delta' [Smithellaceae bacterium]HRV44101.1 DNA polymerase III subunit delta' [Smithellaceae bacterium]
MSFANIYGHHQQINMLQKAMSRNRVGHSYLFSGLSAVGKKALALEFARALDCEDAGLRQDACDACASCRKMMRGIHPDLHVLEAQTQFIRIEAVRGIQDQMTFRPLEGRKRIIIIDDADKMNEAAANALLKTLEEPSADNLLILVTARPFWLPQTILSRCRHVRFNPLATETVARFLTEQKRMEPAKASALASLSGGSIGRALEMDSEDMIAFRAGLSGLVRSDGIGEPMSRLALASFLGQDKKRLQQGLSLLNSYFRDALVYKETWRASMVINADDLPAVESLAGRLESGQLLHNIAVVEKSRQSLDMNTNKSLTLEAMAFKLHW